jgi:exosortase
MDEIVSPAVAVIMTKSVRTRFLFLFLLSIVVAWRPLLLTFRLALYKDAYTQIFLILPLTAAFLYSDWESVSENHRSGIIPGLIILCLSASLAAASAWRKPASSADITLTLEMLALVFWWIGSFVYCFGRQASRTMLFPLLFLLWMVPLPPALLGHIIRWLQDGSALAATTLFTLFGVPVAQDGLKLSIPGLTVEIATECSSIRSSLMLLMTTMVLAQLLLRSPWRKLLLVAVSLPLSVAKNGLRIFTIAMLGTRVDPGFLTGKLHHQGGILFFALALLGIFLVLWFLRSTEDAASRLRLRPAQP